MSSTATLLDRLVRDPGRRDRVTHVEQVPPRAERTAPWPPWAPELVRDRLRLAGVERPWIHQATAAHLAWSGRSVVVATAGAATAGAGAAATGAAWVGASAAGAGAAGATSSSSPVCATASS